MFINTVNERGEIDTCVCVCRRHSILSWSTVQKEVWPFAVGESLTGGRLWGEKDVLLRICTCVDAVLLCHIYGLLPPATHRVWGGWLDGCLKMEGMW